MRPVIALVTGFAKNRRLLDRSFAPLSRLLDEQVIHRAIYVTWDDTRIDPYVEGVTDYPEIEFVRIREPQVRGTALQRGVSYQIYNLQAALDRVCQDDALIVKLRPDFVFDQEFLRDKILRFDRVCAPSSLNESFGVSAPVSPFGAKIWVPWADANVPFHFEDAAFMGLKSDVAQLTNDRAIALLEYLNLPEAGYGALAHVSRYAFPFLATYPVFENYLANYRYFFNDGKYRARMMMAVAEQPFFWLLVIANAWILASHFHVDCGRAGQLRFYANHSNRTSDWSQFESLQIHRPYDEVELWRQAQKPGGLLPGAGRLHARLVDDRWQHALFSNEPLSDFTPEALRNVLRAVASYKPGNSAEQSLYAAMEESHQSALASERAA